MWASPTALSMGEKPFINLRKFQFNIFYKKNLSHIKNPKFVGCDFSSPPSVRKNILDQEPVISQTHAIPLIRGLESGNSEIQTFLKMVQDLLPKSPLGHARLVYAGTV